MQLLPHPHCCYFRAVPATCCCWKWTPLLAGRHPAATTTDVFLAAADGLEHVSGGLGDAGAGAVDAHHSGGVQRGIVLWGDHATADDLDVRAALLLQLLHQRRHQQLVAGCLRAHTHYMLVIDSTVQGEKQNLLRSSSSKYQHTLRTHHVSVDRLLRHLCGGAEERPHIHVVAQVTEATRNHLWFHIMAVL